MPAEPTESYPVRRGKFDSLTLYEVSEQELLIIEKGSSTSLFLNLAIFFLSVSLSFFASIFTVEWFPEGQKAHLITFIVFLIIAVLTIIAGLICGLVWWKSKDSFKETINTIKNRLKAEKVTDTGDEQSTELKIAK